MAIERVIVVVLDGVGMGELPDAPDYGDAGSDTLVHAAAAVGGLRLPCMERLGLGRIRPIAGVAAVPAPLGAGGRMRERSPGKDSVTGHWEMAGVVLERPFPTYPTGFPREVVEAFEVIAGVPALGNEPASGTEIIARLGAEHLRTARPILYTSSDSVFQVAAHEGVIPLGRLHAMCAAARRMLTGDHAVGRVIARPFVGEPGTFRRTVGRRDFPLDPPPNMLDELVAAGVTVHAIGRISEFFNGRAILSSDATTDNAGHMAALRRAVERRGAGLVWANLEDFDMLFGHRNDAVGFARALEAFDALLPTVLQAMQEPDLLILTSDHGNDPTTPSTDHSREHALLLAYSPSLPSGVDLGDRDTMADIAATVRAVFGLAPGGHGASFLQALTAGPA
ncbi:MAG: phosphopentomutase [Chthonomonadales bacterium]|nr:phosphopentomutase [Chthonomonadales bacterium]